VAGLEVCNLLTVPFFDKIFVGVPLPVYLFCRKPSRLDPRFDGLIEVPPDIRLNSFFPDEDAIPRVLERKPALDSSRKEVLSILRRAPRTGSFGSGNSFPVNGVLFGYPLDLQVNLMTTSPIPWVAGKNEVF
jgi:hypothetical protein